MNNIFIRKAIKKVPNPVIDNYKWETKEIYFAIVLNGDENIKKSDHMVSKNDNIDEQNDNDNNAKKGCGCLIGLSLWNFVIESIAITDHFLD